jgi:hypothetical protein
MDGCALKICQGAVINDDLYVMAFKHLVVVSNIIVERHAILRAASTDAGDINTKRQVLFALLFQ